MKVVKSNFKWGIISFLISCCSFIVLSAILKNYLLLNQLRYILLFLSTFIATFSLGKILFTRYHLMYNYLFFIGYSILIYLCLFCRIPAYGGVNLNLFAYNELDFNNSAAFMFTLFNTLVFLPFGLINYRTRFMNFLSIIIFIIICFVVEWIQLVTHTGIFDISDILFYILGFMIGRGLRNVYMRVIKRKY